MNEIPHYTDKFIDTLLGVRRTLPSTTLDRFLSLVQSAQRWHIGPAALPLVWNTDLSPELVSNIRLPFSRMSIEYNFDYARLGYDVDVRPGRFAARKRIIVLEESSEGIELFSVYYVDEKFAALDPDASVGWTVSLGKLTIPWEAMKDPSVWILEKEQKYVFSNSATSTARPYVSPSLPSYAAQVRRMSQKQIDMLLRVATTELFDEVRVFLGLMCILSCDNAPVERIAPPAKLNKKRARHGKAALPEYRTLHITDHTTREKRGVVGTHASPVTHWRRGHIRNQPTAKGIVQKWIKPTIVGTGTPINREVVLT